MSMHDLIATKRREIGAATIETVNARDLHAALGSKRQFHDWIGDRIQQLMLVEGEDFFTVNEDGDFLDVFTIETAKLLSSNCEEEKCVEVFLCLLKSNRDKDAHFVDKDVDRTDRVLRFYRLLDKLYRKSLKIYSKAPEERRRLLDKIDALVGEFYKLVGVSAEDARAFFAMADAVKASGLQYPFIMSNEHENIVYFIFNPRKNEVKIGRTKNKKGRFETLGVGKSNELLFYFECDVTEENKLHSKFAQHRLHGEWFEYCEEIKCYIEHLKSVHGWKGQ